VYLNVLNRSEKMDITARIENISGRPSGAIQVWELDHPDLKATHTFGNDQKVRPVKRTVSPPDSGNSMNYTFPKHSLTILELTVAGR